MLIQTVRDVSNQTIPRNLSKLDMKSYNNFSHTRRDRLFERVHQPWSLSLFVMDSFDPIHAFSAPILLSEYEPHVSQLAGMTATKSMFTGLLLVLK